MISQLRGIVDSISGSVVTLDVNGVGYEVYCSRQCLSRLENAKPTLLTIYTEVREDSIRLYAFDDQLEKQVFLLLMQVKGIGAKTSADIISKVDKRELLRLIGLSDTSNLQKVKGIGKKMAERIIVELRDRVGDYAIERNSLSNLNVEIEIVDSYREACEALQALGFATKDAERAVQQVKQRPDSVKLNSGEVVKEALRFV